MRSRHLLAVPIVVVLSLAASLPSPADQAPSKEKIDKLIEQLGSGSFEEREQASKELSALGAPVLEALRKAAKNGDPEVRKRAAELLPKIEAQAESKRVLAPKRVHLVFKDTPVPDAVADLQKKSGYAIHLHDPQGKLKERKITLDTGETSFWHAVALLCEKAELTEASLQDLLMQAPQLPGALAPQLPKPVPPMPVAPQPPAAGEKGKAGDNKATPIKKPVADDKAAPPKKPDADDKAPPAPPAKPAPVPPAPPPAAQPPNAGAQQMQQQMLQRQMQMQMQQIQQMQQVQMRMRMQMQAAMRGANRELLLKDGKPQKLPTDDRSAVRIRTSGKSEPAKDAAEGEITLALELALEPKLQWQFPQSIRIEKAVDDRDKNLSQVIPQVPGVPGGLALAQQQMAMRRFAQQREMRHQPFGVMGGNLSQQVFVQLKKGDKEAKSIKELNGSVTVQMLTEPQPMIVADELDKAAGKTFKGKEGGSLKIVETKVEEGRTTIRLELEQPPPDKVAPENGAPGLGPVGLAIVFPARDAGKAPQPPAAAAPPGQGGVIGGGKVGGGVAAAGRPPQSVGPMYGLCIQDDKGNLLPIQIEQVTQMNRALAPGGTWTLGYTLHCTHDKEKGQPAKVVYLGRKRATIEIPFALKDVPLP
jgi:hypothetical protein